MACREIFLKFDNVLGGAEGYYDLVDSQNKLVFTNLSTSELSQGMTFSVDNDEIQFRLTNFRLSTSQSSCSQTTTTTTQSTEYYAYGGYHDNTMVWRMSDMSLYFTSSNSGATYTNTQVSVADDENFLIFGKARQPGQGFKPDWIIDYYTLQPFAYVKSATLTDIGATFGVAINRAVISDNGEYYSGWTTKNQPAVDRRNTNYLFNIDDWSFEPGFSQSNSRNFSGGFSEDNTVYWGLRVGLTGSPENFDTNQFYFDKFDFTNQNITTFNIPALYSISSPKIMVKKDKSKLLFMKATNGTWPNLFQIDISNGSYVTFSHRTIAGGSSARYNDITYGSDLERLYAVGAVTISGQNVNFLDVFSLDTLSVIQSITFSNTYSATAKWIDISPNKDEVIISSIVGNTNPPTRGILKINLQSATVTGTAATFSYSGQFSVVTHPLTSNDFLSRVGPEL